MKPLLFLAVSALLSGIVEIWPYFQEHLSVPQHLRMASVDAKADHPDSESCAGRRQCPKARRQPAAGAQAVTSENGPVSPISGLTWVPYWISIDL